MKVYSMYFKAYMLSSNKFYKTVFGSVSPRLSVFRTVDRVQPDGDFAPALTNYYGVAIDNVLNPRYREVCYPSFYLCFT